jgi:alpha-beta hydrolase superfamily lysophospholipase
MSRGLPVLTNTELAPLVEKYRDSHTFIEFKSTKSQVTLRSRRFLPDNCLPQEADTKGDDDIVSSVVAPAKCAPAKGIVFHLPGFTDHTHRPVFDRQMQGNADSGYAAYGFDFEGTGLSEGKRNIVDLSYLSDIMTFIRTTYRHEKYTDEDGFPNVPFFVCGQSMGGAFTILTSYEYQQLRESKDEPSNDASSDAAFDRRLADMHIGSLMSGPAIHNTAEPPACVTWCLRSCLLKCCPLWRLLCIPKPEPEQCWRDEEVREWINNDELSYGLEPLLMYSADQLLELTHIAQRIAPNVTFPYFLVQSKVDEICPPSGAQFFHDTVATPGPLKNLELLDDVTHDIFSDLEMGPKVDRMFADFMDERVEAFQAAAEAS